MKIIRLRSIPWLCFLICIFAPALSAQTVYFQDDFEHGLGKWTVSGYDWALTTSDYRSSNHSATDSPGGNYAPNANAAITLDK